MNQTSRSNRSGFSVSAVLVASVVAMILVSAAVMRLQTSSKSGHKLMDAEMTKLFQSRFNTLLLDPTWCSNIQVESKSLDFPKNLNHLPLDKTLVVSKMTLNGGTIITAGDATLAGQKIQLVRSALNSRSSIIRISFIGNDQVVTQFTVLDKGETLVCSRAESGLVVASARRSGFAIDGSLCAAKEEKPNDFFKWPAATAYDCGDEGKKGFCLPKQYSQFDPNKPSDVAKLGRYIPEAAVEGMATDTVLSSNWQNLVDHGYVPANQLQPIGLNQMGRGFDKNGNSVGAGAGEFCKTHVAGHSLQFGALGFCWDSFWSASVPFGHTSPVRERHPASVTTHELYTEWQHYYPGRNDTAPPMDPRDSQSGFTHNAPQLKQLEGRCWVQGIEVPQSEPSMDGVFHVNQQRDYGVGDPNPALSEADIYEVRTFGWGANAIGCRQDRGYMLLGCTYSASGKKSLGGGSPDKDLLVGTSASGLGNFCLTDDILNPHFTTYSTDVNGVVVAPFPEPYLVNKVSVTAVCGKISD
jgi:hypothetical protein